MGESEVEHSKVNFLTQIYYDPENPVSFSGVEKIYKYTKEHSDLNISRKDVKQFLSKQETYVDHKQVIHNFPNQRVIVSSINYQWDIDLANMVDRAKYNSNYKYFLLAIDCFSKMVYTKPLKTKTPLEVMRAFEGFLSPNSKPQRVRSDKGLEFTAKIAENIFKKQGIKHFVFTFISKCQ